MSTHLSIHKTLRYLGWIPHEKSGEELLKLSFSQRTWNNNNNNQLQTNSKSSGPFLMTL